MLSLLILCLTACLERGNSGQEITGFEIIDSVWCNPPGYPHSLQTDYIWYGKTPSGRVINRRNSKIEIGDTVWVLTRSSDTSDNRL